MTRFRKIFQVFAPVFFISFVSACSGSDSGGSIAKSAGSPDGAGIFEKNCKVCHGQDGKLGLNGAKDLSQSALPVEARIQIITNGKNLMTPFSAILTEKEIRAVANYTLGLNTATVK